MRRRHGGPVIIIIAALLTGCSSLSGVLTDPGPPLRSTDPARLVGRWEGEVDLTFPDRTLVVHSVTRKSDSWTAHAEYGTTNLYLTSVNAVVEEAPGGLTLRFVTPLASSVVLTLHDEHRLRGTFRLANETEDRPIELKRVTRDDSTPSTALGRLSKPATATATPRVSGGSAVSEAPAAPAPPPMIVSAETDLAQWLKGRWEGELDFTVSARVLVIDSIRRDGERWVVEARSGVSDADLTPMPLIIFV